jgi:hypothetical protein
MSLPELANKYLELKERRLALDEDVKVAKEAESDAKRKVIDAFIEAGVFSVDILVGSERKGVSIKTDTFVSILAENAEEAVRVCEKIQVPEVIDPPKVNSTRLQAYVRECLRDNMPIEPELENIIKIAKIPNLSVVKKR